MRINGSTQILVVYVQCAGFDQAERILSNTRRILYCTRVRVNRCEPTSRPDQRCDSMSVRTSAILIPAIMLSIVSVLQVSASCAARSEPASCDLSTHWPRRQCRSCLGKSDRTAELDRSRNRRHCLRCLGQTSLPQRRPPPGRVCSSHERSPQGSPSPWCHNHSCSQ